MTRSETLTATRLLGSYTQRIESIYCESSKTRGLTACWWDGGQSMFWTLDAVKDSVGDMDQRKKDNAPHWVTAS